MVRGLIIRQIFLVLDLVLVGAILIGAGAVAKQLFQRPPRVAQAGGGTDEVLIDSPPLIVALRDRKDYNSIADNGLFGEAGRFNAEKIETPAVVQVVDETVEETQLNLKLWGATSLSPTSVYASASIEDASQREGSKLFFVGDAVVENVTLEEVYPRWVIIKNSRETPAKLERLSMDEEEGDGGMEIASRSSRPARPQVLPTAEVELNKEAFILELSTNYAELVTKVKPELYRDSNGRVAGITAADISDVPLAQQLGLENGDVLQTVNNEKIDSEQKVLEMIQKYQNVNTFRVGILRNGKVQNISYNFN